MPDMPRIKFNSPWTVENIEAELNGTKNARGNLTMAEKLAQKVETSTYTTDKAAIDAEIAEDRAALAEVENKGAKNLAPNTATSGTVSTVSFTVNSDGTVLANGTASTAAWFMTAENLTLQPGTYVISGGQKADGTVNVRVVFSTSETAADIIADSNGESTEFTITAATTANIYVRMSTGRTANNVTVCPMLCTKAEWDISQAYEPYAPTNRELYEEKIDHDLPVVSGSILDYADTLAPGIYFARQSSSTGSGKPVNNRRYVYNIYVYSSATATIMAIEGEDSSNPRMYLTNKVSGTWGSWYKFEGTQVT